MNKTILSIAVAALVSTSAMAGGPGGPTGSANASIVGTGFLVGGSSATAVSINNGTSAQVSGSTGNISVQVNAETLCRDNEVGARLSGAVNGSTSAYASGIGTGTSQAGALQGGGVIGTGGVQISDRDVHADTDISRFGRNGTVELSGAEGYGAGRVGLIGAEGSAAYVKNVDEGYAVQASGAGFDTTASIKVGVDARANGTHGPSGVNLAVDAKNAGEGYSYAVGEAEDAFGIGAAGYLQASGAEGYASGGANEYAKSWKNWGFGGRTEDYAAVNGGINAKAAQGSAGGALNIGDGSASNASITQADESTTMKLRADATPEDGSTATAAATSDSVAVAATASVVEDAVGGTIAGALAKGEYGASVPVVFSNSDCYLGSQCGPKEPKEPKVKGNNGFGNGSDGPPPGHVGNPNPNRPGQDD